MKKDNISDAIGALPDDIIEDAAAVRNTKSARPYSMVAKFAALAAVFALCIVGVRHLPALTPPDPVGTEPPIISPDEVGTENPTEASSDATAETPTEDSSIASTEPPTETPTGTPADEPESSTSNQNVNAVGGSKYCDHDVVYNYGVQDGSFHSFPGNLIEYVGQDEFNKWIEKKTEDMLASNDGKYKSCFVSIVDFVNDFNIPRRDFEVINDNFLADVYDYNLDAIYAGKEAAEAYYLSDRSQIIREKRFVRLFKSQLRLYVENQDATAVTNWIEKKNSTEWGFSEATRSHIEIPGCGYSDEFRGGYSQYSFKEFIDYFNIPRDVVEEIYLQCQNPALEGKLDIDALYAAEFDEEYFKTTSPLEIDMQFFTYDGK